MGVLDILQKYDFFRSESDPYRFFASLYHIALPFEKELLDLNQNRKELLDLHAEMNAASLESDEKEFSLQTFNAHFPISIDTEVKAKLWLIAFLIKVDNYLAGLGIEFQDENEPCPLPIERLANQHYYQSITVHMEGVSPSYMIVPNIEPLFQQWNTEAIDRPPSYFSSTLSAHILRHHTIIKDGNVGNHPIILKGGTPKLMKMLNEPFADQKNLTIGLAPYDEGFTFDLETYRSAGDANKIFFRYTKIKSPGKSEIEERLTTTLKEAHDAGVSILIFPELTVDQDAYTVVKDWLSYHNTQEHIKLVIAGSFHESYDQGGFINRAIMLNWAGNVIWKYNKQAPFTLNFADIKSNQTKQDFGLKEGEQLTEDIRIEQPYIFIDTIIGRMSTLICLDFLRSELETILSRVPCDYFWISAMTTTIRDFENKAQNYGKQHHVLSVCCASKSCCQAIVGQDRDHSFLYAPSKKFSNFNQNRQKKAPESNNFLHIYHLDKLL